MNNQRDIHDSSSEKAPGKIRDDRREQSRGGANRFWWPVLAAVIAVIGVVAVGAALSSSRDRGVRGPADQGAPDAPAQEKVRPSSSR